jgi:hypothetical protein
MSNKIFVRLSAAFLPDYFVRSEMTFKAKLNNSRRLPMLAVSVFFLESLFYSDGIDSLKTITLTATGGKSPF